MPYKQTEVPAELFMEHAGVRVYCTYKNDEIDTLLPEWQAKAEECYL